MRIYISINLEVGSTCIIASSTLYKATTMRTKGTRNFVYTSNTTVVQYFTPDQYTDSVVAPLRTIPQGFVRMILPVCVAFITTIPFLVLSAVASHRLIDGYATRTS